MKIQTEGQHLKSLNRSADENKQINSRFRRRGPARAVPAGAATGNEPAMEHTPRRRRLSCRLLHKRTAVTFSAQMISRLRTFETVTLYWTVVISCHGTP